MIFTVLAADPSNVNLLLPSVLPPLNFIIRSSLVGDVSGMFTVLADEPSYVSSVAHVYVISYGFGSLIVLAVINPATALSKSLISS